jgi:ribonuclease HII
VGSARSRLQRLRRRLAAQGRLLREAERLAAFDARYRRPGALLAGCDEVGRGPLAGPLVAAAVVLPENLYVPDLRDSKALPPRRRERVAAVVLARAAGWAFSVLPPSAVDRLGIERANALVLETAVRHLPVRPDTALVDGPRAPAGEGFVPVVDGDARSQVVAAASVLAKVVRDALMGRLGEELFPGYGFERNAGYGTAEHLRALSAMGPSAVHRLSFRLPEP